MLARKVLHCKSGRVFLAIRNGLNRYDKEEYDIILKDCNSINIFKEWQREKDMEVVNPLNCRHDSHSIYERITFYLLLYPQRKDTRWPRVWSCALCRQFDLCKDVVTEG